MKNFLVILSLLTVFHLSMDGQLHYTQKDLPCFQKKFNVHVHLVLDSLQNGGVTIEQINDVFKESSEKFMPICLSFEVCKIDTITNYNFDSIPTNEEYTELATIFASTNRMNVFILSETFVPHRGGIAKICGLAGTSIFLNKSCMNALTHELGHFFGLAHTFEGEGEELVDGSNCLTAGDRICDTPADPYVQFDEISRWISPKCVFTRDIKDQNGDYFQPQVGNVMSYYNCPCEGFTRGQFLKMGENYLNFHKKLW